MTDNEILKTLAEMNGTTAETYSGEVERLIRKRYTLTQELALHRQRDTKPEEWAEYNAYCEECKKIAKAVFYGEAGG